MKQLHELKLSPGEPVFVDGIYDGAARLVIGSEGERTETVSVEALPEEARHEGVYLRVIPNGGLERSWEDEQRTQEKMSSLMEDVFGQQPE